MQFDNPVILWAIIPLFFILLIFMRIDFIKIDYELKQNVSFMRKRAATKFILFITRFILFSLLIVLLAQPFFEITKTEQGNPQITILIDNSSSMSVFDMSFTESFIAELKKDIPVTVRTIALSPDQSELGEDILKYLEKDTNLLLLSDLQVTKGMSLEDVAIYASTTNTTISAVQLPSEKKDVGVWITGETRVIKNQEALIAMHVNKLNTPEYNLLVTIDGEPVFNARDSRSTITISKKLDEGQHTIVAQILGEDDYPQNNIFHKTITVISPPKILYVSSRNTDLPAILQKTYDVTKVAAVPQNLEPYYAVVIEDMPAQSIGNVKGLTSFVNNGSGLLVVGGMNSFDRGGYKSSSFETLLPVRIGKGEKKQGDSNIILAIDISGTTTDIAHVTGIRDITIEKTTKTLDTNKALAISIVETLNRGNRVGAIAFAKLNLKDEEGILTDVVSGGFQPVNIENIAPLSENKERLVDKISRIEPKGQAQGLISVGLGGAYTKLLHETGSRNIILIAEGDKSTMPIQRRASIETAEKLSARGIKVYVVGIESRFRDEEYLKQIAEAGNGIYFPASEQNNLKVLFGTPEEKDQGDQMNLFILNPSHFITKDLEVNAIVYGFNQVVPKNLARILITTDSGENAVVEWRYGLGKVATYTVFSGEKGLGSITQGNNTRLIYRTMNYLIGNPERKQPYTVIIPDTYINEIVAVTVIADTHPITDEVNLIKINEREYEATFEPNTTGFSKALSTTYAVNNEREWQKLGMSPTATDLTINTGGKIFEKTQTKEIVQYIQTVSKRTRVVKSDFIWPLLIALIIIYLFEILVRKFMENRKA